MSGASVSLDPLGAAWADAMWRASWQGAVALLVALLISRLLPRLSPPLRAWLWRLAFLKLMLGLVSLPPIVLPVLPPAAPPVVVATSAAAPIEALPPSVTPPPPAAAKAAPAPAAAPAAKPSLHAWLLTAWSLAMLAYAVYLARCWGRARRLGRACQPVREEAALAALAELCRRGQVRPPALLAGEVETPLLLGMWRPAIILPRLLAAQRGEAELGLVLAHEVAHLRRRDLVWNWLPLAAQGLFLFHPLVWLGRREWGLAHEVACDAEALELTAASEAQYGEMLVRVALPGRMLAGGLAAMGIAERHHTLRRRLRALAHLAPVTRRRLIAGGIAVALLGLLALVPWRAAVREGRGGRRAGPEQSGARVILSIPYGSGPGQVGRLYTSETQDRQYPGYGPVAIGMIQQTHDGSIWVLDAGNARVLAFRDGRQTESVSLPHARGGYRMSFAVTPQAVFVVEGGHVRRLTRYDQGRRSTTTISLRLPNGKDVMPMWIAPLGARDEAVMVRASGGRRAFRVEGNGRVTVAADMDTPLGSSLMPGADGALWRFRWTRGLMPTAVQGMVERHDPRRRRWVEVAAVVLPKRAKTDDLASALGVDERGNSLYLISEGTPDLVRFVRVDRRGKVLGTFAPQDLALDPRLAYAIGGWVQCQLLPEGDLLLLGAAPEGYRVIRIRPPLTSTQPAPVPLSRLVAQFVARFTQVYSVSAAPRSIMDVSLPMVQAAEEMRKDADSILRQCRSSPADSDAVAAQLLAPLETYARKFRPGSKIDEALFTRQVFTEMSEMPGWGLPANAYLLLELAKQRQSASFTRRALTAIVDAAGADGYLWEQRALHDSDHPKEVAREVRGSGGYHTQTVDALAWCGENFLVDAYHTRPSSLPPAARREIDAYITWRRAAVAKDREQHGWLSFWQAYTTIAYVKRVVERLPE